MTTAIINNMSEKEQKELFTKLLEQKQKAQERARVYRENNKDKAKVWSERARVRQQLLAKKAKEMGITVSEEEIDNYIAKEQK